MNVPDDLKKLADELKLKEHQRAFIELCFSLPNRNVTEATVRHTEPKTGSMRGIRHIT